jgi:hypothetical protein
MKAYWGSGGIAPLIYLGIRWRWVVRFTPRPLYPQGKSTLYPLDRRLGRLQSRSGRGGEEKNPQPPPGIEPQKPDRPARSPDWAIAAILLLLLLLLLLLFTILPISMNRYEYHVVGKLPIQQN